MSLPDPVHSRGKKPFISDLQGEPSQKLHTNRSAILSLPKMLALVDVKCDESLQELDNAWDLVDSEMTKWSHIFNKDMESSFFNASLRWDGLKG